MKETICSKNGGNIPDEISQCFADTFADFVAAQNSTTVDAMRKWSIEKRLLPEIRKRLPDARTAELQFVADLTSNLYKKGYVFDITPEFITTNKDRNVGWLIDYIKANAKKK